MVGPSEGSKARAVLMTVEEFELLRQNGRSEAAVSKAGCDQVTSCPQKLHAGRIVSDG